MAKELAIPCTSHTHEDMFLAMTATRYGIDTGATEMARVKEMLSLDAKGVKHLLERLRLIAPGAARRPTTSSSSP